MKSLLILTMSILSFNCFAITSTECLQDQVSAFEKTRLEKNFSQVDIHLRASSKSTEYAPMITINENKLTIEPIYDNDGICVIANSEFIQDEVARLTK